MDWIECYPDHVVNADDEFVTIELTSDESWIDTIEPLSVDSSVDPVLGCTSTIGPLSADSSVDPVLGCTSTIEPLSADSSVDPVLNELGCTSASVQTSGTPDVCVTGESWWNLFVCCRTDSVDSCVDTVVSESG
jgi:hypothetical protein